MTRLAARSAPPPTKSVSWPGVRPRTWRRSGRLTKPGAARRWATIDEPAISVHPANHPQCTCLCLICRPARSDPARARPTRRNSSILRSAYRNRRGRPSSFRKRLNSNSRPRLASRDHIIGFSSFPGDLPIPIPDRRNTRLRIYATLVHYNALSLYYHCIYLLTVSIRNHIVTGFNPYSDATCRARL